MSIKGINWARKQEVAGPAGMRAVLGVHADHANVHGASWPAKQTVADATNLSKQTVENYERALVKQGKLIPVPWMLENGTEGRKGFFLGCARRKDGTLPNANEAFKARVESERKRGGPGGRPLEETPSWWSGDKTPRKTHTCTSCGGACHGADQVGNSVWYPGEGTTEMPMPDWVREAVEADAAKHTAADSTLPPGTAGGTGGRVSPAVPLNPKEEQEPPKAAGRPAAAASGVLGADDAHASSGAGKPSRGVTESSSEGARGRRLKEPLMAYLAALGDEAMDVIVRELDKREGTLLRWGRNRAADEFGIARTTSLCDDLTGRYTCRAVAAVLMRQTQSDGGGLVGDVKDLLAGFEWPEGRPAPKRRRGAAAEARSLLPRVTFYEPPPGTSNAAVHDAMIREVMRMPLQALLAKFAQLRAYRRGDVKKYETQAQAHCSREGIVPTEEQIANLVVQYAIQHYAGKWPMYVDPNEPVDIEVIALYEKALAELREAAEAA